MKILLTGANGYIGSRLLGVLLRQGHTVVAAIRNLDIYSPPFSHPQLSYINLDLLKPETLHAIPLDIDVAYYLVHSMSYARKDFPRFEEMSINNFLGALRKTQIHQLIYLTGLCSDKNLSAHLSSRYKVETIIIHSGIPYTVLRAGIIIGSGSASFEMIRDLTEKLPIMVAPKWVDNPCQPISIDDTLRYLTDVVGHPACIDKIFDIGGPDLLSYKEMMLGYAKARGLTRHIGIVPVLTPKLSSYWLYLVTSVNYYLASSLVDSVKNKAICSENTIKEIFPAPCLSYQKSIEKALDLIEQDPLVPSWKDSYISGGLEANLLKLAKVPTIGCLTNRQERDCSAPPAQLTATLFAIGGKNGWYYMNWAWSIRGFIDKLVGGVGLQRGRTNPNDLRAGSSLDFWRVLHADRAEGRLLLYAEMKVPGEAWLEFQVTAKGTGSHLKQTASFRPLGLWGRFYWYSIYPIHVMIFKGMTRAIVRRAETA
jgi:uncharacterized protein YbjT (DUF2867 family)